MKYFEVDGIVLNPETIDRLRNSVIATRDAAIRQGLLDWGFELSLVVALIGDYKERIEKNERLSG